MNKLVRSIEECYNNLEYKDKEYKDNNIMESLEQMRYLTSALSFEETVSWAQRFAMIASAIENNLDLFMSSSKHIDTVLNIIDYFNFLSANILLVININGIEVIENALISIYCIYQEHNIQKYLEKIIVRETEFKWYYKCKASLLVTDLQIEIILLEDSDLHAVISYLKFKRCVSRLKKIWVHKSIIHIFMWHFEKNVGHLNVPIQLFQSKQELLPFNTHDNILIKTVNILSIWSEDIIAATNLARSLNQHIIFINTHMDICPNVIFPIKQILCPIIQYVDVIMIDQYKNGLITPTAYEGLTYDLFYDGMWQKPKNDTYWIHKNILFANATSLDIIKCVFSAAKGFETLSTMSIDSRRQMLSKFATILECHGQFSLSEVVSKWINMSYIYGKMLFSVKTERFDVLLIPTPRNTVVLQEENEITLFQDLTQNLIIGNSVIVICNPDLCILAPYCNMFKMCGIPPGVINLLSIKDANDIIRCHSIGNVNDVNEIMAMQTFIKMHFVLVSRK